MTSIVQVRKSDKGRNAGSTTRPVTFKALEAKLRKLARNPLTWAGATGCIAATLTNHYLRDPDKAIALVGLMLSDDAKRLLNIALDEIPNTRRQG